MTRIATPSLEPRRRLADDRRLRELRRLREDPTAEADRDHGLERAWGRRLAGRTLVAVGAANGRLELLEGGGYRRAWGDGAREAGIWTLTSSVGRVSLLLHPEGGAVYGHLLTRDAAGVALNGEPHQPGGGP
jgi:hypothetical protein